MYGRLSDIWSRKIILLLGLAIFFVGSLASSLAQSVLQLTIFRAFTGIGGGGLMTVAQLIVSDVVPLRERGKYQGILVSSLLPRLLSPRLTILQGCRRCFGKWHRPCHRRCTLVEFCGLVAMDL